MLSSFETKCERNDKKKKKEKIPIEDGVPEAPQLCDFLENNITKLSTGNVDSNPIEDEFFCNKKDEEQKKAEPDLSKISHLQSYNLSSKLEEIDKITLDNFAESSDSASSKILVLESTISEEIYKNCDLVNNVGNQLQLCDSSEKFVSPLLSSSGVYSNTNLAEEVESKGTPASVYSNLRNEVKTSYLEEIQTPSAPIEQRVLTSNKQDECTNNVVKEKDGAMNIKNYEFTSVIIDSVIPFTDEELSQFYNNPELKECQKNVNEFLNNEIQDQFNEENLFFKLLMDYAQAKSNLQKTEEEVENLKNKINTCSSTLWSVYDDVKVTEKGVCSDGNSVVFVHKYTEAQFNSTVFQEYSFLLERLKHFTFKVYVLDAFVCSFLKLKVEYYLQCLLTSCPEFTNLHEESTVTIFFPASNSHFQQCKFDLKKALSTLFMFQRNQKLDVCKSFLEESRQWISDLISVLLRIAEWKDHLFILNHLIRCPGGVSKWAVSFVQMPCSTISTDAFNDAEINHILCIMNILLSTKNQTFSNGEKWESELGTDTNPWAVVDSDGEIECDSNNGLLLLKENDLVSILNQIPFCYLFKTIFKLEGDFSVSFDYLLKLLSFSTTFVKILHNGLLIFSLNRYKQFTKRLGRLIYHIVKYVTQVFTIYKAKNISEVERTRIQAEYDNFFLRSATFIYSAQKHGAWQFLVSIPYNVVSNNTLLKLYGLLQLNDENETNELKINFPVFEEKFSQLSLEDQFYLLTTFANIAETRDASEVQFLRNIVLQLFYIGYVSSLTKEDCYKNVCYSICSICSLHPFLISEVLNFQNEVFVSDSSQDHSLCIFLWSNLPLKNWLPVKKDIEILSDWLLKPLQCVSFELSKIILQSLNYSIKEDELFIPLEIHRTIAFILLEASIKLMNISEQGLIKNMSNFIKSQYSETVNWNDWIWSVLLKLRLHLLDQTEAFIIKCFENLGFYLEGIPELENRTTMCQLVMRKDPTACFVALMTTSVGHSLPIIFDKGFELVEILFKERKYEAGIACLEHMTLLCLECSESLHNSKKFVSLLHQLVVAENTYIQMAKNLISNNFPGTALKCLELMIQNQLNFFKRLNYVKFRECLKTWLLSLTRIPLWTQESKVLYLIDKILKNSFFYCNSDNVIKGVLQNLLEENASSSEVKSSFSSLVDWMNPKFILPTLLPNGFIGEMPWFAFQVIQMEFEIYEEKTTIWNELLKSLYASTEKKISVDNSLKKVCNLLRKPVRSSKSLAIYRWSNQILNTELSHPLIPLLWQQFFFLFFFRVPGSSENGSAGLKFFDGIINQRLFQQLKQRITETCEYFKNLGNEEEEKVVDSHFVKCYKLFQAFFFWATDPRLHDPCFNLSMLPAEYSTDLFKLLIQGNNKPWIQFLEYQKIEQDFTNSSCMWFKLKKRMTIEKLNRISAASKEKSPIEILNEGFNSYETPFPPPWVNFRKYSLTRVNTEILANSSKLKLFLRPYLGNIIKYKEHYWLSFEENESLASAMQDLIKNLYYNEETITFLKSSCNGVYKVENGKSVSYSCSGPATVNVKFNESKINREIQENLKKCEKAFNENIHKMLYNLPDSLNVSGVIIDVVIQELIKEYHILVNRGDVGKLFNGIRWSAVDLFYELIRIWSKETESETPQVKKALEIFIEALGKTFIQGSSEENNRILQCIMADEVLGAKLLDYFTPNVSCIQDFIEQYSRVLDWNFRNKYDVLLKFNLLQFLLENKPKISERTCLITSIERGIIAANHNPAQNRNMITLLNQNLEILLRYDFPEHYGEILNFLLEASQTQSIPTSTWFVFLNAITFDSITFEEGQIRLNCAESRQWVKKLKYSFNKYASENKMSFDVIKGTITVLAKNFKNERSKVGMNGLHGKYSAYVEPILIFCGILSYSCVARALEMDAGSLSEKITQELWPLLSDLYAPWLIPYCNTNNKTSVTQEGNFEKTVLLPWTTSNLSQASFSTSIFAESIRFILDTIPGFNSLLSYVWFFYVNNFAHIYVKDFILNIIHECLLTLPWDSFFPCLQDVELMLKVVEQFLPSSHSFLGKIFINVKWTELVQYYRSLYDEDTVTKLHISLLHLLVKLPLEPSLKQNEKITALLNEARDYAWHLIDSNTYEVVLNWFIMSCDPRIILMDERLEHFILDSTIFRLLQICAGYSPSARLFHSTTLTKRVLFVRACVKWLISSSQRFKSKDSPLFRNALCNILDDIEAVITETTALPLRVNEASVLLVEFLEIFKESDLRTLVSNILSTWLSDRKSNLIIFGLLRSVGKIDIPEVYITVVESVLENYFTFIDNCEWTEITSSLGSFPKSSDVLEKAAIDGNCLLTFYAALLKRTSGRNEKDVSKLTIVELLQLFTLEAKLNINTEPKLLLIMKFCLKSVNAEYKKNVKDFTPLITKLSEVTFSFTINKGNGFLWAVGLKKSSVSDRFKFICLVISSGITMFLKKHHSDEDIDERSLKMLELSETNKLYHAINQYVSYARIAINDIETIDDILKLIDEIALKLFNKQYLK